MAPIDASKRNRLTVAVVGAECSGKTTLAEHLALRFDAPWVPEYARGYLRGRQSYDADDVLSIAQGQHEAEAAISDRHHLVIADTDLVVIKVWWDVRFGGSHDWIDTTLSAVLADERGRLYLLPTPDIPWIADPLRENPDDRPALHALYRRLLDSLGVEYLELSGSAQSRLDQASAAVQRRLSR